MCGCSWILSIIDGHVSNLTFAFSISDFSLFIGSSVFMEFPAGFHAKFTLWHLCKYQPFFSSQFKTGKKVFPVTIWLLDDAIVFL